jgi:L-2-hydroxyglutarate oxidase
VAGRDELYRFCAEHGIAHDRCGKLVVAGAPAEVPALEELARRGRENGLKGLKRLTAEELRAYEPRVAGVAGLWVPETGIVDFKQVAETMARRVREADGEIRTGVRLINCARDGTGLVLGTTRGEVRASCLINCGGLYSDRIARTCGARPGLQIVPFRGEYYVLKPERRELVNNLIYPVPDPRFPFLGVHFTRRIDGRVEAGPNAVLALRREGYAKRDFRFEDVSEMLAYRGFWRMAARYGRTGLGEVYRSWSKAAFVRALRKLIPELTANDIEPGGSGVRAQAVNPDGTLVDDFRIVEADRMIHVLNAPSPAATASLAIGRTIAGMAARNWGGDLFA